MDEFDISCFIDIAFMKTDSNYKVLKGEKYELVSLDGSYHTDLFTNEEEYGDYHFYFSAYDPEDGFTADNIISLLPQFMQTELRNAKSGADLERIASYSDAFSFRYLDSGVGQLFFKMPIRFRQVVGTNGNKQSDIFYLAYFDIRISNGKLSHKSISMNAYYDSYFSDGDIAPINNWNDLTDFESQVYDKACMDTDDQGRIIITDSRYDCSKRSGVGDTGVYYLVPYFVEQKGEVVFEIENTVNGLAKYNASKDKNLEYKIYVKNIGNASSGENVITTYVPKELEVVKNKISDAGVYDDEEHTITWNIDRIDIDETVELSYKAIAPGNVNGKELIGKSSINSTYVLGATYSNNTVVTLDRIVEVIKNPETGTMVYIANTNIGLPLNILIILLVVLMFMILVFVKKFKKVS